MKEILDDIFKKVGTEYLTVTEAAPVLPVLDHHHNRLFSSQFKTVNAAMWPDILIYRLARAHKNLMKMTNKFLSPWHATRIMAGDKETFKQMASRVNNYIENKTGEDGGCGVLTVTGLLWYGFIIKVIFPACMNIIESTHNTEIGEIDRKKSLSASEMALIVMGVLLTFAIYYGVKNVFKSFVRKQKAPNSTVTLSELQQEKTYPFAEYTKLFADIRAYLSARQNDHEEPLDIDNIFANDHTLVICSHILKRAKERRETDGEGYYLLLTEKRFAERSRYNELSKEIFNYIQNDRSSEQLHEFWESAQPGELHDEIISTVNAKFDDHDKWYAIYNEWLSLRNTLQTSGYDLKRYPIFDQETFDEKVIFTVSTKDIDTDKDPRFCSVKDYDKSSLRVRIA